MVLIVQNKCLIILFLLKYCSSSENLGQGENITKLYELIANAIKDDFNKPQVSRRVINDSGYQIHINKLKDVNGFKMHNIVINHTDTNSTIYIDNPLESRLPHPFMTLEEFKDTIVQQRLRDRKEFLRSKKIAEDRKKWADIKSRRTFSKQTYTKAMSSKNTAKIGANTKSLTVNRKYDNKSITAKGKPNTKEHINVTVKEIRAVKNIISLRKEDKFSSTLFSGVKLLYVDENYPRLPKLHKKPSNVIEGKTKIEIEGKTEIEKNKDRETATTIEKKIEDKDRKQSTTVEEQQSSTLDDNHSTEQSTIQDGESILRDGGKSTIPNEGSIITDTNEQLATVDEKGETNVDETEATNGDERETTSVSDVNGETSTESSTTTTTTLPPTTRERWSRPRVYLGDMSGGASTSSIIS